MNYKIYNNFCRLFVILFTFHQQGRSSSLGWHPVLLKNFDWPFRVLKSSQLSLLQCFAVSSYVRKSRPLGFLGVFCPLEFQVHPSDNNILSHIICGSPISSIYELTTFMCTLEMSMDMSLGLPSLSLLTRQNTLGLLSLGVSSTHTGEQHTQTESFLSSILFQCKGQSF